MSGSEISFGVNGKVRMITFVRKEWRYASGRTRSVVIGKLGKG